MNAAAGNCVNVDSSLSSIGFGKPMRKAIAVGTVLLALVAVCSRGYAAHTAVSDSAHATQAPAAAPTPDLPTFSELRDAATAPDFAAVSKLVNDAIAAHRLPGAVVVIGHGGKIVFHQAYGSRKLAGEPGLDGSPAPAEPMTEDTIFDLASLTKSLATATAVMQLYEQGKVQFDDPVQTYLPDFNTANDPRRAKVTVRMLLTHTSGERGTSTSKIRGDWTEPTKHRASIARSPRRWSQVPVRFSATPTSTTFCLAR